MMKPRDLSQKFRTAGIAALAFGLAGFVPVAITDSPAVGATVRTDVLDPDGDPVGQLISEADAIVEDLTTIASQEGISVAQATLLYGWHDEFAQIAAVVEALLPSQFAGSQVNPNGEARAVLSFVGAVPTTLSSVLAGLPVPVTLIGNAPFSMRKQEDLVAAAHYAIHAALPAWTTNSAYDAETNSVTVTLGPLDPNNPPAALTSGAISDLAGLSNTAMAAVVANPPSVAIHQEAEDVTRDDTIRGGAYLTYGSSLDSWTCTSGWPVKKNGSTQKGVITADHCPNNLYYSGRNVLTYRTRLTSSHGDIDYRSSTEAVGKEFYYGTGTYRAITGLGSAPSVGQQLCKYGRKTGYTCDTVRDRTTCRDDYCNLVSMDHRKADGGDSGGPWFSGSTAYGVHSGGIEEYKFPCCTAWHDQYTPIYNTLSELGVSLNR